MVDATVVVSTAVVVDVVDYLKTRFSSISLPACLHCLPAYLDMNPAKGTSREQHGALTVVSIVIGEIGRSDGSRFFVIQRQRKVFADAETGAQVGRHRLRRVRGVWEGNFRPGGSGSCVLRFVRVSGICGHGTAS